MGANQPNPMFSQAGAGLPPELMQAFAGIASQLQQKQQQINAPKKHPILEALGQTLLMGPAGAIGMNIGTKQRNQNLTRQAELDALQALQTLAYSVGQTNNARNDTALAGVAAPLFQAAGVSAPQQMGADGLNLLGGLNAPAVMALGNQQIQGGAGAGYGQGINLMSMFEGAPKVRPYPKRETVATVTPDGGRVANQGGEKYQAPAQPQGDGYEYVPMGEGIEGSTGIREVPTQQPLQVEAGAEKQLPVYIPPSLQASMLSDTQRAMTGASGQVPAYAELPSKVAENEAQARRQLAAAFLDDTQRQWVAPIAKANIRQSDASATNSLASAGQTQEQTRQLRELHPLNLQLKQLEVAGGLSDGQIKQLAPFQKEADLAYKAMVDAGLVDPKTKEVALPKPNWFTQDGGATPEQRKAYDNYQKASQALRQKVGTITGSSQPQAQPAQQSKKDYRNLWSN